VDAGDWRYTSPRASVFYSTSLDTDLRSQGIDTLVMAGIASSDVLFSSVGWSSDADYRISRLASLPFFLTEPCSPDNLNWNVPRSKERAYWLILPRFESSNRMKKHCHD
jgi:nicotinamidase-related amidase